MTYYAAGGTERNIRRPGVSPRMNHRALHKEFTGWFDQYADQLFRHAYLRLHNRDRGADLMQETFMRAWSYLARGGEIREPRAFLYKTLNNLIINEYERRRPTSSLDELDDESGFEPEAEEATDAAPSAKIDADIILRHLGANHPAYRDVLVMRYIDDLSISEMAKVLDDGENTVSVRIHRALKKLREIAERDPNTDTS